MEVIKTTAVYALKQLFTDNVAFTIASFLVEDPEEKREEYKALCATLYGKTRYDSFLFTATAPR